MKTIIALFSLVSFSAFAQIELNNPTSCSAICTITGADSVATKLVLGKGTNPEKALIDLQASCDANKTCGEETAEISTAIGKTGTKSFDEKLACNTSAKSREFTEVSCFANLQQPVIVCNNFVYQVANQSFQVMSAAIQISQENKIQPEIRDGVYMLKVKITGKLANGYDQALDITSAVVY